MFEWVTHSGTRVKMLKMFFKDVLVPLYGLEIAQALKASPGTTHRELNALLSQNIISKKKEGALVMYRLNTLHPYFEELKAALFPKKRSERLLLLSGLELSPKTSDKVLSAFQLFLDYAQENASEIIFLGNSFDLEKYDGFRTYLFHQSLCNRLNSLAHEIGVTVLPGSKDQLLSRLVETRLFDSKIAFAAEYKNPKWGLYAVHEQGGPNKAQELTEQGCSYVVFGSPKDHLVKEFKEGIYFAPGSFHRDEPHFVEIDKDGGALIAVKDLK